MKTNSSDPKSDAAPARLPIRIAAYAAGLMCVAAIVTVFWSRHTSEPSAESSQDSTALEPHTFVATNSPIRQHAGTANEDPAAQRARAAQPILPEPPLAIRQLVTGVVNPERFTTGFTPEQTAAWKEKLQ